MTRESGGAESATETRLFKPLAIAVALLAAFAFGHALAGAFVIDDRTFFVDNDMLPALQPWQLWSIFSKASNYWGEHLPLRDLLFVIQYKLFGQWAAGYHLVSLALYTGLCLVAYRLVLALYRLFVPAQSNAQARLSALLVVAIFALHPLRVEIVAYITEQKDLLYGLTTLTSLWLFVRYLQDEGRSRRLLVGACVFYYLAFLSKGFAAANAVVFPAIWLLAGRPGPHKLLKVVLFWVVLNLPAIPWLLHSYHSLAPSGLTGAKVGLVASLLRGVRILGAHTLLFVFPEPLNFGYPFHQAWRLDAPAVAGFAVLAGALAALVLRRRSLVAVGACIYLLYFIPVLRLFVEILNAGVYDRYLFMPSLGAAIVIERGFAQLRRSFPAASKVLVSAAIILCVVLAGLSHRYVYKYRSNVALFGHGYRHFRSWTTMPFAYVYCLIEAGKLTRARRVADAEPTFARPSWVRDYFHGWICLEAGDLKCAVARLSRSSQLSMGRYYPFAEVHLGRAYRRMGELDLAAISLKRVMRSRIFNPLEYYKAKRALRAVEAAKVSR